MIPLGVLITSTYDRKVEGPIVGYGVLHWPDSPQRGIEPPRPEPVYLVQVAEASSSLGPACRVVRMDHAIETRKIKSSGS